MISDGEKPGAFYVDIGLYYYTLSDTSTKNSEK